MNLQQFIVGFALSLAPRHGIVVVPYNPPLATLPDPTSPVPALRTRPAPQRPAARAPAPPARQRTAETNEIEGEILTFCRAHPREGFCVKLLGYLERHPQ